MLLTIFTAWKILGIVTMILLIVFWKSKNSVWGGLLGGSIVGLIIAFIQQGPFDWYTIAKGAIVGALIGILAELLGKISDRLKKNKH